MRYAVLFGVVLAFAALAYLGVVSGADFWFTLPQDPGWLDGSLWWVAVTAGAGVAVGVLRRVFRLPTRMAGTVEELRTNVSNRPPRFRVSRFHSCRWRAARALGRRRGWG